MAQIAGKMKQLPEVRSCQANITNPAALQRLMHSFEHALQLLVAQASEMISLHTAVTLTFVTWSKHDLHLSLTSHCQYGFHTCTVHTWKHTTHITFLSRVCFIADTMSWIITRWTWRPDTVTCQTTMPAVVWLWFGPSATSNSKQFLWLDRDSVTAFKSAYLVDS